MYSITPINTTAIINTLTTVFTFILSRRIVSKQVITTKAFAIKMDLFPLNIIAPIETAYNTTGIHFLCVLKLYAKKNAEEKLELYWKI